MTTPICIYDSEGMERLRRRLRLDPRAVRELRNRLCKRFAADDGVLGPFEENGPHGLRLHRLQLKRRYDSAVDGATRLLLKTDGGDLLESVVLRAASGRTTLCVSSQVGCAAACRFCATGQMKTVRDLSAEEILDQALIAGQLLAQEGRRPRNVVFMGMGEPFHNEDHLHRALETLLSADFFHFSPGRLLVSTVGVADGMLRLARRFPAVRQALSLHSVRQEVRERLIPLARKYPLDLLRETIVELNRSHRATVMIEYLLLAGVNDSADDIDDLIAWLDGLQVHVNLIPYNPIDGAPRLAGSDRSVCQAAARRLKAAGLKTTIRRSLGSDISAACGQLVRQG